MSGRYVRLAPGRYTLAVEEGEGPAGLHRSDDRGEVVVGVGGGRIDFTVRDEEQAYYWWRGPRERPGVRLFGVSKADRRVGEEVAAWPTGTTG